MTVRVRPESFGLVAFDAAYTARVAEHLATVLGVSDIDFDIEIDETTARVDFTVDASVYPVLISANSGSLEDKRRPRQQGEHDTTMTIAHCMLRTRDRIRGGFADAPPDRDLSRPHATAWNVHIASRLAALGLAVNKQAWLYDWRNRHGFSDTSDEAFEKAWAVESTTWAELAAASDAAMPVTA